jgi:hypothetical protein
MPIETTAAQKNYYNTGVLEMHAKKKWVVGDDE